MHRHLLLWLYLTYQSQTIVNCLGIAYPATTCVYKLILYNKLQKCFLKNQQNPQNLQNFNVKVYNTT